MSEINNDEYSKLSGANKMLERLGNAAEVLAFIDAQILSPGSESEPQRRKDEGSEHRSVVQRPAQKSGSEEVRSNSRISEGKVGSGMTVIVRGDNIDGALHSLKKELQRAEILREMRQGRRLKIYSEMTPRERAAEVRRRQKVDRKKVQRKGKP